MSTILITGATGFIGKNLVQRLITEGHNCRCLVRKNSRIDFLRNCSNVELFYGDITQKESLTDICKGIEVVINAAGILATWQSSLDDLRPVNTDGIVSLAGELIKNSVKYVIHLSAGGVTGPVQGPPADETYECRPQTAYEKTKLEGEQKALELCKQHNLSVVVVRPTFTYGPGDPHKLPLFRSVKSGSFVFIGSGESTNHPVYIDDLIAGILLLLKKRVTGEIFIIGGPQPVTKKDLIQTIAEELGVKKRFLHIPRWLATCGASVMVALARLLRFEPILTPSRVSMMADNWGYSIEKAKEKLGYMPQFDLKQGIKNTVQSYRTLQWL